MAGALIAARAGFGDHFDVTHRAYSGITQQAYGVGLVERRLDDRHAQALERDDLHVGARRVHQQVGHAVGVLPRAQLHIGAKQLGIGQEDRVVAGEVAERIGVGPGNRAARTNIGCCDKVGIGAGGEQQIAAEVAKACAVGLNPRHQIGRLIGERKVDREATVAVDPHLVDDVDVGVGGDVQRAAGGGIGLHGDLGTRGDSHHRTKAQRGGADGGGERNRRERARARRSRIERVLRGRHRGFVRRILRADHHRFSVDRGLLTDIDLRNAAHRIGHCRAAARQQTDREIFRARIEVVFARRRDMDRVRLNPVAAADGRVRLADQRQGRVCARNTHEQAAARGGGQLIDRVGGIAINAQPPGVDLGIIAQPRPHHTAINRGNRSHAHRCARAHRQGVGFRPRALVGMGADLDRGRLVGNDLGARDRCVQHRRNFVFGDRAGGRSRNQAERGSGSEHLVVEVDVVFSQHAHARVGDHLAPAKRAAALHRRGARTIDHRIHRGGHRVVGVRATARDRPADRTGNGHRNGGGIGLD